MSAFVIALAVLFLFAVGIVALPYVYGAWRRIGARKADLQIWRVMARRGIAGDGEPATQAKLAHAIRRCVFCPNIEQCDRSLAADDRADLTYFCPNATLLEELGRAGK